MEMMIPGMEQLVPLKIRIEKSDLNSYLYCFEFRYSNFEF
jgi:hypothetical protein